MRQSMFLNPELNRKALISQEGANNLNLAFNRSGSTQPEPEIRVALNSNPNLRFMFETRAT